MIKCPICFSAPIASEVILKSRKEESEGDDAFRIFICRDCGVRYDGRSCSVDYEIDLKQQELVNYDFYKQSFSSEEFEEQLSLNRRMISSFSRFAADRERYVEIGIGLGFLARAAAELFENCYGLDLEVETATSIGQIPDNLNFSTYSNYLESSRSGISCFASWHVLEHIANPHEVLPDYLNAIKMGGIAFGQIPLYSPHHVFRAHYIFYHENSLIRLMESYGLVPLYFERDEQNNFLSFCFRKVL